MSNNLTSNISTHVIPKFMESFNANRVICKTVDRQTFDGKFTPDVGSTVYVKRPHDYRVSSTSDGDLTSETTSKIVSGKASATVQNFKTVFVDWTILEQATQLDQLEEILKPMATRLVTDLETDFADFMLKRSGLVYGTPGTAIDAWTDVAGAGALMKSIGVPTDEQWNYVVNPAVGATLASLQAGLSPGSGSKVDTAWENAMVSKNVGGFRVLQSNALASRTNTTAADLVGALSGAPTLTYVGAKDTMTQVWAVTGFTASATVKAGSVIEVTGKYYCSQSTRQPIVDATGAGIKFRAVVTEDVTLGSSGEGNLTMSAPAIYEANGQYNTTTAALSTDVITILGTSGVIYQPALFYHPKAFSLATVKLPKLSATESYTAASDGISLRFTKWSDATKNQNKLRVDLLPAYGVLNPFFAGQGYGV